MSDTSFIYESIFDVMHDYIDQIMKAKAKKLQKVIESFSTKTDENGKILLVSIIYCLFVAMIKSDHSGNIMFYNNHL